MEEKKERYWICAIGPTDQNKLPSGCDSPMRKAVTKAFKKITKHDAEECLSGWGNDKEKLDMVNFVWSIGKDHPAHAIIKKLMEKNQRRWDEITNGE